MAGEQIAGLVDGVCGLAVSAEIIGHEPESLTQRPVELALEGARGSGVSVQKHEGGSRAAAVPHCDLSEGTLDLAQFQHDLLRFPRGYAMEERETIGGQALGNAHARRGVAFFDPETRRRAR